MHSNSKESKASSFQHKTWQMFEEFKKMKSDLDEEHFQDLLSIQPERTRIGSFQSIKKLAKLTSQKKYEPFYSLIQKKFSYCRYIFNDGNSFYRAFAFYYLTESNLESISCLSTTKQLNTCNNLPYNLRNFSMEEAIQTIWRLYLQPISRQTKIKKKEHILRLFNSSYLFDSIFVAYFRSISYYLIKAYPQIRPSTASDREIEQILVYGSPTRSYELDGFALAFRTVIVKYSIEGCSYKLVAQDAQRGRFAVLKKTDQDYIILNTEKDIEGEAQEVSFKQYLPHHLFAEKDSEPAKHSSKKARIVREFLLFLLLSLLWVAVLHHIHWIT